MSTPQRQMHIGVAIEDLGVHQHGWRTEGANRNVSDVNHFVRMTQEAEQACFDFVFCADNAGLGEKSLLRHKQPLREFEPMTLLSALAMVSTHIGLVGTISTTFNQPYMTARQLSALDHISNGRAAWNVVTSHHGERNFGIDLIPVHEIRYAMADEYIEACTKLWDSWEDDARIMDVEQGIFADPDKIHEIDFHGDYFNVEGPLNISRSPQGRPVIVQAGSSEWGMNVGAKWAEVVFTSQHDLASSQRFYAEFKRRVAAVGRDPQKVAILPGISPFVAATEKEARDKWMELNNMTDAEQLKGAVERQLHIDLSEFELDDVVPAELLPPVEAIDTHQSRYEIYRNWVVNDKRTIRELSAEATSAAGHWLLMGSGEQVADRLIERFDEMGADGFNIVPAIAPTTTSDFIEHVVPILQDRGYFRTEYPGTTLRDTLGLDRPESQYARG